MVVVSAGRGQGVVVDVLLPLSSEIQVWEPPQRAGDHDGEHPRILLQRTCDLLSRPLLLKQGDFWFSPSSFFVWI
jgi:hypothetical protein